MSERQKSRKRKKGYYIKASQGKRSCHSHQLEPNMKGFLITCNNREREAVREAYNILNEYADELYGPDKKSNTDGETDNSDSNDPEDIETALRNEITSIKEKKLMDRRFQVVDSGAKNCVFIKTNIENPLLIVHKYLSDVYQSKTAKSRFIMRLHPVMATCHTDENKVSKLIEDLLTPYMATGVAKTYCILIKVRNNNQFGKSQIFPVMRQLIQDMNPGNDFDDKNPDYVFSVDVIKSVCCFSVMTDYYKFRKYNVQEIVKLRDGKNGLEADISSTGDGHLEKETVSVSSVDLEQINKQTSCPDAQLTEPTGSTPHIDPGQINEQKSCTNAQQTEHAGSTSSNDAEQINKQASSPDPEPMSQLPSSVSCHIKERLGHSVAGLAPENPPKMTPTEPTTDQHSDEPRNETR